MKNNYQKQRISHWDKVSGHKNNQNRIGAYYDKLVRRYYRFLVPKNARILEIGCGHGDLLASLKPSFGVGADFSSKMIAHASAKHPELHFVLADAHHVAFKQPFDIIILSDLINDLWDVQSFFENIRCFCHPGTRIIINFFNNVWRLPLSVIRRLGIGFLVLEQSWFSPADVSNLLEISGFDIVKRHSWILSPLKIPFLTHFANQYLVHFPVLKWFALTNFVVARLEPPAIETPGPLPSVSVVVPARNEAGNIRHIINRIPDMGTFTEIIFVEGHSKDNTYDVIRETISQFPDRKCKLFRQTGNGKGDAVRLGFDHSDGDILMILDADMTVAPEDLPRFYDAIVRRKGEFINGVRLVYPMENQSMRFLNILGNKFFSLAFSWLLSQPIKDTLCGTKVLWKQDYETISKNRDYFGDFDPFGDFDLLFGADRINLKIIEIPIRYRSRQYGDTNIQRWRHGWLLLKMVLFAARRIKCI